MGVCGGGGGVWAGDQPHFPFFQVWFPVLILSLDLSLLGLWPHVAPSLISGVPVSSPGSWGSVLFLQTSRKPASKPLTGRNPFWPVLTSRLDGSTLLASWKLAYGAQPLAACCQPNHAGRWPEQVLSLPQTSSLKLAALHTLTQLLPSWVALNFQGFLQPRQFPGSTLLPGMWFSPTVAWILLWGLEQIHSKHSLTVGVHRHFPIEGQVVAPCGSLTNTSLDALEEMVPVTSEYLDRSRRDSLIQSFSLSVGVVAEFSGPSLTCSWVMIHFNKTGLEDFNFSKLKKSALQQRWRIAPLLYPVGENSCLLTTHCAGTESPNYCKFFSK